MEVFRQVESRKGPTDPRMRPLRLLLGHEASGVVERIGANVSYVKPGERVIMSFKPFCGQCYYCIRGEAHLCNDPGLAARSTCAGRANRCCRWPASARSPST